VLPKTGVKILLATSSNAMTIAPELNTSSPRRQNLPENNERGWMFFINF